MSYRTPVDNLQNYPISPIVPNNDDYALVSSSGKYVPMGIIPVFNVKNFGAKGDGVTDDSTAIANAAAAASVAGGIVHLPAATYAIKNNLTLTGNYTVHFEPGAILAPTTGNTITLKDIRADFGEQLFNLANGGIVNFVNGFSAPSHKFSVKWFGAKGDGSTDDTVAIQATIDAALNLINTSPSNPTPITFYEPYVDIFLPRGNYYLGSTTDTAYINLPDYFRFSGEQSILIGNDTTKHIMRIGAYFNIIENINFYSGKAAIICNGFSNHYDGYLGTVTAGANNIIRNCSFMYNHGPSIMLDTYGSNRGSSASIIVDKCWFTTSCVYFGGFDGCTFKDCYITAAQAVDINGYSQPVYDDDGYIMPVFANYDELVLEHCTMTPQTDVSAHGAWIQGVGNISAHNTRFGGESKLVIVRCKRNNFSYAGISVNTVADPMAFPQLNFENCAMSSAAGLNWLEIYDRFPTRISIKSAAQGTNTGTNQAPPQAPLLMMQSLGVWIDPVTCPTSTFLNTVAPYIIIDIDSQIDAGNTDFRFRTSSNPLAFTGSDIDITDKLQQYFVKPLKGGRASLGVSQNYWPASQNDFAHASGSSIVGLIAASVDTTTGYSIQGYTANTFNNFNELVVYFLQRDAWQSTCW
jgi:hypothetical protein